jgi:hypothetical protein
MCYKIAKEIAIAIESVAKFKYLGTTQQIKIVFMKRLRAD